MRSGPVPTEALLGYHLAIITRLYVVCLTQCIPVLLVIIQAVVMLRGWLLFDVGGNGINLLPVSVTSCSAV